MEHWAEFFILLMVAVAFTQSGVDKITDWKGNLEFHSQHFKKSPFRNMVSFNLIVVMIFEIVTGALALIGGVILIINGQTEIAKIAAVLAAITFGMLFTGQRLAKDYGGAQTIVIYLMPVFFLLWLLFK
ncbi:MAG: DoxX family protein [Weeksellaceae bacterium]